MCIRDRASLGLGAGKLRTVFKVVLPSAIPGILSGVVLATGRIVGETAALIYTCLLYTSSGEVAFATKKVFSAATNDAEMGFDFQQAALDAIEVGDASFEYDGATYELTTTEKETSTEVVKDGEVYATVSNLLVRCV